MMIDFKPIHSRFYTLLQNVGNSNSAGEKIQKMRMEKIPAIPIFRFPNTLFRAPPQSTSST